MLKLANLPLNLEVFHMSYSRIGFLFCFLFSLSALSKSELIIKSNEKGKYGVVKTNGNLLISFTYDTIIKQSSFFLAKRADQLWELFDTKGERITHDLLHDFYFFENGFFSYKQQGKWGLFSSKGKTIYHPYYKKIEYDSQQQSWRLSSFNQYIIIQNTDTLLSYDADELEPLTAFVYKYRLGDKWGIFNSKTKKTGDAVYDGIDILSGNILLCTQNKKQGLLDTVGNNILPCVYDRLLIHDKEHIQTAQQDTTGRTIWSLFNRYGKKLTTEVYDRIEFTKFDNSIRVYQGNQCGLINYTGEHITPIQYDWIDVLPSNEYITKNQTTFTWLDKNFENPTFIRADSITYFYDTQTCLCTTPHELHLFNKKGRELYCTSGHIIDTKNRFIRFVKEGRMGLVDSRGCELAPPLYDSISFNRLSDSVFWLFSGNTKTIISTNGRIISKPDSLFSQLYFFSTNDFIGVLIKGKYGFIDSRGRLRIANQYEGIQPFSNDMAGVRLRGKWGYVNRAEQLKVQPYYDAVFPFTKHSAIVKKDKKYGMVNRNGEEVTFPQYDSIIYHPSSDLYLSFLKGKKGIINSYGEEAIYAKYDAIYPTDHNHFIIEKEKRYGIISLEDVIIKPLIFDGILYNPYTFHYLFLKKGSWQITQAH